MAVNFRVLRREIASQAPKVVSRAEPFLKQRFEDKKKDLLQAFDDHEVTKEIQRGPGTQTSLLDQGNLYSAIGFDEGEHPTTPLRAYLKKEIDLDTKTDIENQAGRLFLRKKVFIPTLDEVNNEAGEATPVHDDWTSRAWTDLIEKGIPGFPRFLSVLTSEKDRKKRYRIEESASGTAIQVKTANLRGGSNRPISYISGLLARFKASISANKH